MGFVSEVPQLPQNNTGESYEGKDLSARKSEVLEEGKIVLLHRPWGVKNPQLKR